MSRYEIAIVTDSTSDLPDEVLHQYEVSVVPLYIIWGQQQYRDRVDIQPHEFYERLKTDPVHPTTSQPAPSDFAAAAEAAHAAGAREVVVFTISSGMSSTYGAARQGVEGLSFPVHVVDSRANSLSLGFEVLAAARAREAGGDAQAMIAAAERVRDRLVTRLYVDTLDYLHKGGRISLARWWIGTALNLKPVLMVDHTTGKIEPRTRGRNRRQAIERMVADFFEAMGPGETIRVGVLHGNVPDQVEELVAEIRAPRNPAELLVSMTSPVMGVHTGPGALALCGYAE